MLDHLTRATIVIVATQAPMLVQHRAPGVLWCRTAAELAVLARHGPVRTALIEHSAVGIDARFVASLRRRCAVIVIDDRALRPRWEALGVPVLPQLPPDQHGLEHALADSQRATRSASVRPGDEPPRSGALVAVIAAPGASGAGAASAVARALAATCTASERGRRPRGPSETTRSDGVVLADLTLDGLHRPLHGLDAEHAGLPELVTATRFGETTVDDVAAALHHVAPNLALLPGLRRHHDWITVGEDEARAVVVAVTAEAEVVVAHIERDLEGEADTGSFDIEDRNGLARTVVRAADLLLVAASADQPGQLGLRATLSALAAFRAAPERTIAIQAAPSGGSRRLRRTTGGVGVGAPVLHLRSGDRPDVRLGRALRVHLATVAMRPGPFAALPHEAQRIVPGTLGRWAHDMDGWITPSVPQQP